MSKFVEANKKIEEAVVSGYKKIEETVVGGYKKIEDGVTGGYGKVEDWFVENFLAGEMESVEEAKARMKQAAANKSKRENQE